MASIEIAGEQTAAGFWRFRGSGAELRIAAQSSFRNSDGVFVPSGRIFDSDTCLVVPCVVNEDKSVSIPTVSDLFTTFDSIDNRNVQYVAGLFPERGGNDYQQWPDETTASGFSIQPQLAPATTWSEICLTNRSRYLVNPPQTYLNLADLIRFGDERWGTGRDASEVNKGFVYLDVPPLLAIHPEAVGSNSFAALSHYGIARLSVAPASATNPIAVGDNDSRMTNSRPPTGGAGGVLSGSYPNPGFAVDMATQAELNSEATTRAAGDAANATALAAHETDTTNVHGIVDTSKLVVTSDVRVNKVENYLNFADALTQIGSTPTTLYVTTAVSVSTATVPESITLKFIRGGSLNITTGQTLTILGDIEAGPYTIFTNILPGQGTLSFEENHAVHRLKGEWFGMKADGGVTDNTPYIQAVIDCIDVAGGGFTIELRRTWEDSFYSFSSKASGRPAIDFERMEGITIEGANPGHIGGRTTGGITRSAKTEMRYDGTGTMPFIWGDCAANIILRNLAIQYSSPSFTGDFISWSATQSNPVAGGPDYSGVSYGNILEGCYVAGLGGNEPVYEDNAVNARMLLNIRNTVECGTVRCVFSIARRGVGGRVTSQITSFTPKSGVGGPYTNNSGTAFANSVTLHDTRFAFIRETATDIAGEGGYDISQPGVQWEITGGVFEPSSVDTGVPWLGRAFTTEDTAVRANANHIPRGITVSGCGFWDATGGGTWVKMRGSGWVFSGCLVTLYNNGTTLDGKFIKMYGDASVEMRGLVIQGCTFTGLVTVSDKSLVYLDKTGATAGKVSNIVWKGNAGDSDVIPPPPGFSFATAELANFQFTHTTRTSGALPISPYEGFIFADASGGAFTLPLPLAPTPGFTQFLDGRGIMVMKTDSSLHPVTLTGNAGTETIGGSLTSYRFTRQGQCALFVCNDGVNWMVAWETPGIRLGADASLLLPNNLPFAGTPTTDTISDSNNQIKAIRFTVPRWLRITKIAARIGVAGNVMGLGIYDSAGSKLATIDSLSISSATTTVTGTLSSALALNPDVSYWVGWAADTTVPTFSSVAAVAAGNVDLWNQSQNLVTAANALAAGVMPSTLGALTSVSAADSVPFLLLYN